MLYLIIPKLKLIVGWNPKCGCTTIKTLLLNKLNHEIIGNVHLDMLTKENLISGKYDIFSLTKNNINDYDYESYLKVCIKRNPFNRLISGLRQRSRWLCNEYKNKEIIKNMLIKDFVLSLKTTDNIDDHFNSQTSYIIEKIKFDLILDIENNDQIKKFYNILGLNYSNIKYGDHTTKYNNNNDNYKKLKLKDLTDTNKLFNKIITNWFDEETINHIKNIYKDDFLL